LLIVRDLISNGTRTYSEFLESPERVSTNILAARLRLLTSVGIIERVNPNAAARNNAYQLTPSGLALRPVLEGLGKWSQVHLKTLHSEIVDVI
jgi:DNA-binding HxlR family transcriptional regulator